MSMPIICRKYCAIRLPRQSPLLLGGVRRVFINHENGARRPRDGQRAALNNRPSLHPLRSLPLPEKTSDPLRILFFGSDKFSIASLQALHKYRQELGISSIDVACKASQHIGRGLKKLSQVPIKKAAEELSLPVHEIHHFTPDWELPKPNNESINLLIAVSFGLLIPRRVIERTKYGGLNLHPSALPDLRGAAPLHHTLLQNRTTTAISLQTLHPTKFDHGLVVLRSGRINIPSGVRWPGQPDALCTFLSPIGADLLVRGIYQKVFVPPLQEALLQQPNQNKSVVPHGITTAPKITAADRHIDWSKSNLEEIRRRRCVLGFLWNTLTYVEKMNDRPHVTKEIRIVIHDLLTIKSDPTTLPPTPLAPGTVGLLSQNRRKYVVVRTACDRLLAITRATLAGDIKGRDPVDALYRLHTGSPSLWPRTIKLS